MNSADRTGAQLWAPFEAMAVGVLADHVRVRELVVEYGKATRSDGLYMYVVS